jgi:hypothetical protein
MAASDNYYPPHNLDFKLTFDCQYTSLTPRRNYSQGDDLLLRDVLSSRD